MLKNGRKLHTLLEEFDYEAVAVTRLVTPVVECVQLLKNARRSALIVSACVVGIPCGKSL